MMSASADNGSRPARRSSRRRFIVLGGQALAVSALMPNGFPVFGSEAGAFELNGPGTAYTPFVKGAFVRRKEYGMWWPGEIYDGDKAMRAYRRAFGEAARNMGVRLELEELPLYSAEEADRWIEEARRAKPDGLFVVLLDRQEHAWPAAAKAADTAIPTVVFAPVGAAFTTNTWNLAAREGIYICSTNEVSQPVFGMKMIAAAAKLRETRYVVLKGEKRSDARADHFGTRLRTVPAADFLNTYRSMPVSAEIRAIAKDYLNRATRVYRATEEDVINGVKSYAVAREILRREEGDAITMDCLGALGRSEVSLPCIAWSRMLDMGIPAACEADIGAALTHALVQYLFDRPGFQQDPVPETAKQCLIGAHCTCPTKLRGFGEPAEPYHLSHHHGNRDAVPVPRWTVGQRMTSADIVPKPERPQMIVSSGTVAENVSVPPAGGCVVSVMVKLDGVGDYLGYPGFHQIFFYGDYKRELLDFCKLYRIEPVVA